MKPNIAHLSYSSISTYLYCPRSWAYRYIEQVQTPTSSNLVFGSAFHDTLEEWLCQRTADPMNVQKLTEIWPAKWDAQVEKNPEMAWMDSKETLHNDGLRMFGSQSVQQVLDAIVPGMRDGKPRIETKVELRLPDVPLPIIGYIDLITEDGIVCDFKTSSKSWDSEKARNEIQPLVYMAALMQAGERDHALRCRHYVFVKTKTPQVQTLDSTHTVTELFWLLKLISDVWQAIEAGSFFTNPTGWKCSPQFCEFYGMCRGK